MIRFLAALTVFVTATAHAQPQPERLSDRGRILIAGELGGWWQNHDDWHVDLGPSVAFFLRDRIGLGGYFTYSNARDVYSYLRTQRYPVGAWHP